MAQENKTKPTDVSVSTFIEQLVPKRQAEAHELVALFEEITQYPPVMWGPSIIGFGQEEYNLASGRTGIVPMMAFSPRKTAITIYLSEGFVTEYAEILARLGKYKTSVVCLYINKLADIDRSVLKELIKALWDNTNKTK